MEFIVQLLNLFDIFSRLDANQFTKVVVILFKIHKPTEYTKN